MVAVTVLAVAFRLVREELSVWLASGAAASTGEERWALPGQPLGVDEDEMTSVAALMNALPFHRDVVRRAACGAATAPDRRSVTDPTAREIALVSWAIVRPPAARGTETPSTEGWHPVGSLPPMIGDHAAIVGLARWALRRDILSDPLSRRTLPRRLIRAATDAVELGRPQGSGAATPTPAGTAAALPALSPPALFGLLPDPFPLSAIRRFYETLLDAPIDRGNFRRKLVELRPTGIVKELPIYQRGVRHRAAQLFTFDQRAWERWTVTLDAD